MGRPSVLVTRFQTEYQHANPNDPFSLPMRRLSLLLTLSLITTSAAFASEIREFDLKTVAQLGREMNRVSQRADQGAIHAFRKREDQKAKGVSPHF